MRHIHHTACVLVALGIAATAAPAQTISGNTGEQIYRLKDSATYQQGCFEPCLCPVLNQLSMRGTMVLGPTFVGDVFDFREVTEVNWYVSDDNGNEFASITGSGIYYIANWPGGPPMHALELDLQVNGGEVTHFFSDLVPMMTNDGSFDIQISMNGVYCYDIVMQVVAAPVPPLEIKSYRLNDTSTYQEGCWDPCDCILYEPVPLTGTFKLVPLRDFGTYVEYGVVDVDLEVHAEYMPFGTEITGAGLYTLIAGFAGMIESMDLKLRFDGSEPFNLSSGFINSGEEFPEIDIDVSMNGMECWDIVLGLRAKPRPGRVQATNGGGVVPVNPPAATE